MDGCTSGFRCGGIIMADIINSINWSVDNVSTVYFYNRGGRINVNS